MRDARDTMLAMVAIALTLPWLGAGGHDQHEASVRALEATRDADWPDPTGPEIASEPGVLVIDLDDDPDAAALTAVATALGVEVRWVHPESHDEGLVVAQVADLAKAAEIVRALPGIEAVEPRIQVTLPPLDATESEPVPASGPKVSWPDDPLYPRQWHLRAMHADEGWWSTPAGAGVIVAVVDTGVRAVEDLDGARILPGTSFVPGVPTADDDNGHGTHVAGTIAQTTHNGLGVAGVAPHAVILPVKVLSAFGGGTSDGVAAGIDWAVDQGAQVINLSLGSGAYSEVVHVAVKKAREACVLVVAAAGNDGRGQVSWPGALAETIGVAAVGPDGTLAPYSNHGKGVDIAAPGGDKRTPGGGVLQDTIDGPDGHAYKEFQGTSMAAPHVAGAAAVLLSTGFLSPDDVERLLLAGADGKVWSPKTGWGRLDLEGSLALTGGTDGVQRFALGAGFAWLIAGLAGPGLGFRLLCTVLGGFFAGGLAFLGTDAGMGPWLSRGVLSWPILVVGPWWGQLAAWLGAVVALLGAFLLGPFRLTRPVALGLCAGIGAHLTWALMEGTLVPWFLPTGPATLWLAGSATVSLLAAMAMAGTDRLDRGAR